MKRAPILLLLVFLTAHAWAAEESRVYHPVSIADLAAENPAVWKKAHTHVRVEGWVTYVKKEADSDRHVRICEALRVKGMNRKRCIVAEAIPSLPIAFVFRVGQHVAVWGIYRFDAERAHGWAEVHPIEGAEVLR